MEWCRVFYLIGKPLLVILLIGGFALYLVLRVVSLKDASIGLYVKSREQCYMVGFWHFWDLNPEFVVKPHNYNLTYASSATVSVLFILSFISGTLALLLHKTIFKWIVFLIVFLGFHKLMCVPQWVENCKACHSAQSSWSEIQPHTVASIYDSSWDLCKTIDSF